MKKLINILSIAAVASLTVLSCQKEQEVNPRTPSPAEVAGCYGVYFPTQEASGDHVYSPLDDPEIEITVARTNDSGAITVPIKATYSEDGIFVPQDIQFADGQKETTIKVRFDKAKEGVNYKASFTIEDGQYASLYNSNPISIDFSIMRVEMLYFLNPVTKEKAVIHFDQSWWGESADCYIKYYEVDGIRTCFTETFSHLYNGATYDTPGFFGTGADYEWTFYWYVKSNYIRMAVNNTGYHHPSYDADIYALDYYYYETGDETGADFLDYADENSDVVSYYDGNGGFYLSMRSYYMFGIGGWNPGEYDVVGVAEGFTRVDYSLELESDFSYEGVSPIYVEAGVDVAGFKYAIYEGELTATQVANKVAAITDGTDASELFTDLELDEEDAVKYATLGVSPEETGLYTFVAVAIDEAYKAQNSASVVFNYVSAEDEEEYAVDMYVFTEDTPERYASYHAYDSFAFGIVGKELTDVHVGIFKLEDVAKDADAYFNAVKLDEDGEYAVSEEILAKINGEGGYYDIATQMPAKTELIVLVWATNGSLEAWDYDTYTTEPMPYVWNSLGKGTITDGFLMDLFGEDDVTLACDVYEEATTPGLYMVTGFQLELCAAFYEMDPSELAPYEGYNWWNAEIVVDATDPTAVFISEQDYGIYVNSSYGYVMIETAKSGTLADGAITFPAKEMYIGLTKASWYYGNNAGTFKITLPAVNLSAPARANVSKNSTIPTNFVMARDAKVYEKPVMVFERNPKPVKASVKVDYTRKEKNTDKKFNSDKNFEVR